MAYTLQRNPMSKPVTAKINIERSELAKIPFIDGANIGERVLTTLTFFDEDKWHFWIPTPDGLHFLLGQPVEGDYFAKSREAESDVYLEFLNFMAQRACWLDALKPISGIQCDIHNLGASLAKIELFYEESSKRKTEVTRFVSTEIEYIFGVCRSLFDLLQETIGSIWGRIRLVDTTIMKKNLPSSFRKMVMSDRDRMSSEQIEEKWSIPRALADYYYRQGEFFEILRSYRDRISHHGHDLKFLFVTEKGFAVSADAEPFSRFDVWNEEHMQTNRLASLRPVLAHIITETLRACEEFTWVIQSIVEFPPEIAPGYKLFLRGHHTAQLLTMNKVLEDCLWWENQAEQQPKMQNKTSLLTPDPPPVPAVMTATTSTPSRSLAPGKA